MYECLITCLHVLIRLSHSFGVIDLHNHELSLTHMCLYYHRCTITVDRLNAVPNPQNRRRIRALYIELDGMPDIQIAPEFLYMGHQVG